jgi:charged multivesicular body protein 4A/B
MFGGGKKDPQTSTHRTVDAIQRLAEVSRPPLFFPSPLLHQDRQHNTCTELPIDPIDYSRYPSVTFSFLFSILQQEEMMEKRRELLEKQVAAQLAKAKEYLAKGNKPSAQLALKRKAMIQKQLETVENNITRLGEQKIMLEDAAGTAQTVAALKYGADAQRATMAEFKIEKVDKIMDEVQEAAEMAAEVQSALALPLGPAAALDEDELEAELAELEAEEQEKELLRPAPIPSGAVPTERYELPAVPTGRPGVPAQKTTEDELAELEAELAAS